MPRRLARSPKHAGFDMARIRTIKPEFWTSEQVAECSLTARLAFIGIWNFCDDRGIHPASVKRLKMEVFPSDSISESELQGMVGELLTAGLLDEYEVDGKGYWQVTGWEKHQKIEKPTYRHPVPQSGKKPEISPSPRRVVVEQSASARPRNGMESKGSKPMSGTPDAVGILDYLNVKASRSYKPVKANLSLIVARLAEGSTPEECRSVIDAKVTEWAADPKMRNYLRPETLFGATKFAGYVGQLSSSASAAEKDWT
jgi:uncharacterized phage protein (TIGR02220 family)